MLKLFKKNSKIKLRPLHAFIWIIISTLFVSGGPAIFFFYYKSQSHLKLIDPNYYIIAIVQSCPNQEIIKNIYLTEMLDLSVDKPTNLYAFSIKEGLNKLMNFALIKHAQIKKLSPGTLFVDYTIRQPVAHLGNYKNTAIDEEGIIFPFEPFFTPKKLPTLYINPTELEKKPYGKKIPPYLLAIFHELKQIDEKISIETIDLSKMNHSSAGQREIILTSYQKKIQEPLYIRIHSKKYHQSLIQLKKIIPILKGNERILDLRLDSLLFIKRK